MFSYRPFLIALTLLVSFAGLLPHSASAGLRLDSNAVPRSETIELFLDAEKSGYTGTVEIEITIANSTKSIEFNAEGMVLESAILRGSAGFFTLHPEEELEGVVVVMSEKTIPSGSYVLQIRFVNEYNMTSVGLYKMTHDERGYLFTQFESIDARKAFPCWDEPIYKIPFQMTIHIPEGQEVVTNSPVESETSVDGVRTIVYRRTPPLPAYLIAIAAGPLESTPISGLSVPGRIYTVKGQSKLTGMASAMTPIVLEAIETYFGRPYPYEKLDLIAIPEFWPGAMENPGAITFKDRLLLVDPEAASVVQRRTLARVTAHELAHMWFGDLVTMSWWDDLWLNEAFADWLGDKVTDEIYPELGVGRREVQKRQNVFDVDARSSSRPIRRPVSSPDDMLGSVGVTYDKGKAVLGMIEQWIGPETFQLAVRRYINENEWGNTVAEDLWSVLSDVSGKDVGGVLSDFLDRPGYPLILLERSEGGIRLSQTRFVTHGQVADELDWRLPIRIKYPIHSGYKVKTVFLTKEPLFVPIDGDPLWVLPDAGAYGYYRWKSDTGSIDHMLKDAAGALDTREMTAFLGNTWALLQSGDIGGDEYLSLLEKVADSGEPEIVSAAMAQLDEVGGVLVPDRLIEPFGVYVHMVLRPALDRIGIEPADGEPESRALLRPGLLQWLGRRARDEEVIQYCNGLVKEYLEDHSSVDPTIAGAALSVAGFHGDRELYDAYLAALHETSIPADRSRLLSGLSAFQKPELQDETLQLAISGQVRPDETFTLSRGIGWSEAGADKRLRWAMENFDVMAAAIPDQFISFLTHYGGGCSLERLELAKDFYGHPDRAVEGTANSLYRLSDSVNECAALRLREGAAVEAYLNRVATNFATNR